MVRPSSIPRMCRVMVSLVNSGPDRICSSRHGRSSNPSTRPSKASSTLNDIAAAPRRRGRPRPAPHPRSHRSHLAQRPHRSDDQTRAHRLRPLNPLESIIWASPAQHRVAARHRGQRPQQEHHGSGAAAVGTGVLCDDRGPSRRLPSSLRKEPRGVRQDGAFPASLWVISVLRKPGSDLRWHPGGMLAPAGRGAGPTVCGRLL